MHRGCFAEPVPWQSPGWLLPIDRASSQPLVQLRSFSSFGQTLVTVYKTDHGFPSALSGRLPEETPEGGQDVDLCQWSTS